MNATERILARASGRDSVSPPAMSCLPTLIAQCSMTCLAPASSRSSSASKARE